MAERPARDIPDEEAEVEAGPAAHAAEAVEDEVPVEGEGPAYCNEPRP